MMLLIFYYIFSACFMLGYTLQNNECNFWIRLTGIILGIILAPILFPLNLGVYVYKNS